LEFEEEFWGLEEVFGVCFEIIPPPGGGGARGFWGGGFLG